MKSADPTEWANRRKAAVERAKQIREERKNVLHEGDTFAPSINPKRSGAVGANGNNSFKGGAVDSLDRLVEVARPSNNDVMEMPLPAQRNKNQSLVSDLPPSPNSDALGKELKKFGGPVAAQNSRAPPRPSAGASSINSNSNSDKYKSQFLRQYEDERSNQHSNSNNNNNQSSPAVDTDETFSSMLRNDGKGDMGPGWNDDTTFRGFGQVKRRQSGNNKPKTENDKKPETTARSSAFRGAPPVMERVQSDFVEGRRAVGGFERNVSPRANSFSSYSDAPLNGNSRFVEDAIENRSNGLRTSPRANELAMAKPALSLLKNKIRQSESSGSSSRSFNRSTGAGLTLNNNEEFQPSIGRRTAPDNLENSYQFNPAREQRRSGYGNGSNGIADAPARSSYSKRREQEEEDEEMVEVIVPARRSRTQPQPQPVEEVNSNSYYNSRQQPGNQSSMSRNSQNNRNHNVVEEAAVPTRSSRSNMGRNVVEEAAIPPQQARNGGAKGFGNPQPPSQSYGKYSSQESDDDNRYNDESFAQDSADEGQAMDGELQQCPHCERKFNPIAFSKHVKICEKVFLKKRKVFDSTKMRVKDDPELLKLNMKAKKEEAKKAKQAPMAAGPPMNDQRPIKPAENGGGLPKWKAQSSAFRQAMQAMREYNKAKAAGDPLPPPVVTAPDPSLILCPHCGRRFNEKAAERHIPKCQSIVAKPSALKRGAGGATSSLKAKR
eukprot:gene8185-9029_t